MINKLYSILTCLTISCTSLNASELPLNSLTLPEGYQIEVFADDLPNARQLARSDSGVIFVSTRSKGKVYALVPQGKAYEKITLLDGLFEPHGLVYHQGDLYVAEVNRITKYPDVDNHLKDMPAPIVLNDTLPDKTWHGYRVLKLGPDGRLYVAIGMPCNTCFYRDTQPLFGTISTLTLDGKDLKPYAIGIRNSVGFGWHPQTQELWFTDNGQDMMGANIPPDEINRAMAAGQDFGFPYVYGDNLPSPDYKPDDYKGLTFTTPKVQLQAHVAPLGLLFNTPEQILVAEHGSWNRVIKVGYQIMEVTLKDSEVVEVKPFITGWLQNDEPWGRPVDLMKLPDGSILITDDLNGVIYRVSQTQR